MERIEKEIKDYERENRREIGLANLKKQEQLKVLSQMVKVENLKLIPSYHI